MREENSDKPEHNAAADPAAVAPSSGGSPASVMDLLAEHVPLALLADLVAPNLPVSFAILESEGLPDDAWWEDSEATDTALGGAVNERSPGDLATTDPADG